MTALQYVRPHAHYLVQLPRSDDFAFWRERARALIQCDIPPDKVAWVEPGGSGDLFAQPSRNTAQSFENEFQPRLVSSQNQSRSAAHALKRSRPAPLTICRTTTLQRLTPRQRATRTCAEQTASAMSRRRQPNCTHRVTLPAHTANESSSAASKP